jgi:SagB-type dehydrogenase family enzyme
MQIIDEFGTLSEEYHVASRCQAGYKHVFTDYQIHYDPHIQQLAAEAPLHLTGYPVVVLPAQRATVSISIEDAITCRSSGRRFASTSLAAEQLATLLYLANTVRQVYGEGIEVYYQRNVPNSGNLGAVEIFPVIMNVAGIEAGIYHYDSLHHHLARLHQGHFHIWLRERVFYQMEFAEASVALILTTAFGRLQAKYGLRGYRLGLLDTGHVSENIYLVGTGLGLQVCATAGFVDDELDKALGLDGLETATSLVILVGPSD